MTVADIKARPFGALSDSQGCGRSHQQAEGVLQDSVLHLPERQSFADMSERLVLAYEAASPSTMASHFRNRRTVFGQVSEVRDPTKFFQAIDYSDVVLIGSATEPPLMPRPKGFHVDLVVLHAKGHLAAFSDLPIAARSKLELEPETLKLQEVLETRKANAQILGDSVLHSFDILSFGPGAIRQKAAAVFASGGEEILEDGMESSFTRNLSALLKEQGQNALLAVEDLVRSPETNRELAFEATRLLGALDDSWSLTLRRKFLEELLDSTSVRLRHAAASGLAAMDDPAALSAVERAVINEQNERLKKYLALVVQQLQQQR
jgi:hypothetical protein